MSGKTLSNGTLSLRFMQNAQRAKQQTQVQLEEAQIADDAEWHVSQEVRDSWTSTQSPSPDGVHLLSVTQEPSYLPFVFETEHKSSGFKGRRSFKRGKEVVGDETPTLKPEEEPSRDAAPKTTTEPRPAKRPVSISGFKSNPLPNSKIPQVAARSLIAQDADVGTDMKLSRRRASAVEPADTDVQTGFVKPSGVDMPPAQGTGTQSRAESILLLAKSQAKKRGRDEREQLPGASAPANDVGHDEALKKRKKKKKAATALGLEG